MNEPIVLLPKSEISSLIGNEIALLLRSELEDVLLKQRQKDYLTQQDLAELTGWSFRQLAYKRAKGELPFVKRGRTILYKTADVYAWLDHGYVPVLDGDADE